MPVTESAVPFGALAADTITEPAVLVPDMGEDMVAAPNPYPYDTVPDVFPTGDTAVAVTECHPAVIPVDTFTVNGDVVVGWTTGAVVTVPPSSV